jgi:hypothetical protein
VLALRVTYSSKKSDVALNPLRGVGDLVNESGCGFIYLKKEIPLALLADFTQHALGSFVVLPRVGIRRMK